MSARARGRCSGMPSRSGEVWVQIREDMRAEMAKARTERRLTQAELGFLCDRTSQSMISALENDRRPAPTCTRQLAELISYHLRIPLRVLFEEHGNVASLDEKKKDAKGKGDQKPKRTQSYRRPAGQRGGRRPGVAA